MKKPIIFLIKKYQKYISKNTAAVCRFSPTCSNYAIEALEIHGFLKGGLLSFWRILRCNPFGKAGYDPVPEKGHWKNEQKFVKREKFFTKKAKKNKK